MLISHFPGSPPIPERVENCADEYLETDSKFRRYVCVTAQTDFHLPVLPSFPGGAQFKSVMVLS
jgi:hypothetical protein